MTRSDPRARDPGTPRRTSPLAIVVGILDVGRLRSAVPAVVLILASGRLRLWLGALVVAPLAATAGWWRRKWWIADGVLHLDEGIFVRSERRIPLDRVQHVEIEVQAIERLLGLARVRVETAGGKDAEFELTGISIDDAELIRGSIRGGLVASSHTTHDGSTPPSGTDATSPPFTLALPVRRLLLAGITGPEVAVVAGAFIFGLDTLADFGVVGESGPEVGELLTVIAGVAAIPLWFVVAALVGLVRHWGYTLTHDGAQVRVRYGLLNRRELVVPTARIHRVRISHRLLLRPFGRADLQLSSASSGSSEQSRVDIPLLTADEIDAVLAQVLPAACPRPALDPPPPAARRRLVVRAARPVLVLAVVLAAWIVVGDAPPGLLALPVAALVPAALVGLARYRSLGAAEVDGVIHSRRGILQVVWFAVPVDRVQSTRTAATWFQRRIGLHDIVLDLVGASVRIEERPATPAVSRGDSTRKTPAAAGA